MFREGPSTDGRRMKSIKELLREALAGEGLDKVEHLLVLRRAWEEMGLAGSGAPSGLEGDCLVVRANSHAWAQELSMRREEILAGLKDRTGIEIRRMILKTKPKVNI